MLVIHPEAKGMALMQSSPLEATRCTLALTYKGVHCAAKLVTRTSERYQNKKSEISWTWQHHFLSPRAVCDSWAADTD